MSTCSTPNRTWAFMRFIAFLLSCAPSCVLSGVGVCVGTIVRATATGNEGQWALNCGPLDPSSGAARASHRLGSRPGGDQWLWKRH